MPNCPSSDGAVARAYILFFLAFVLCSGALSARADVQYLYDEQGRVTTVIAPTGARTDYNYDDAGNITSVRRSLGTALSISEFTPNIGQAGNAVTIYGSGFSAVIANNIVRFNGTSAIVSSASTTQLRVAVPASGSTGPLSVTVGGNTVTSTESFTYASTGAFAPPTITSITPEVGVIGTQVTIVGTNFDLVPGATKVEFEGPQVAGVVSLTPTQIVALVPPAAGTGPIRVLTPRGIATSADFYIAPANYVYADIIVKRRATLGGGTVTLNINAAPNKHGMMLFTGQQGQHVTVQIDSLTATSTVAYKVYTPTNVQLDMGALSSATKTIHLPVLPRTGTYAILFSPGAANAKIIAKVGEDKKITTDGSSLTPSTLLPGQTQRITLTGAYGQKIGVGLSGLTTSDGAGINVYVYKPDGAGLANTSCNPSQGGCNLNAWDTVTVGLPVTGTYTIVLNPFSPTRSITGGSLTLSSDIGGALTAGTPSNLNIARVGQNGRFTFAGTQNQPVSLSLDNLLTTPPNQDVKFTLYRADGQQMMYATGSPFGDGEELYISSLPATETYTVLLDPAYASTGTMSVTLNGAMEIAIDGPGVAVTPSQAQGFSQRLRFAGTAGQKIGVGLSALTTSDGSGIYLALYKPDGALITGKSCVPSHAGGGCNINAWDTVTVGLPVTGTYTIVLKPDAAQSITGGTLTVSSDTTGAIAIGGPTVTFTTAKPGQNGQYTFSGTAGQSYNLQWSASSFPENSSVLRVYKPDGAQLASANFNNTGQASGSLPLTSIPGDGVYTIFVDPYAAGVGQVTLRLQ